ncbi:MAG: 2-oxoacid:ferredoxin oxidoreductase subunit gamma [Deltaproteobacteria bacterium]|nr:2-oxoacid:ferredoxin oxidoreductase subunit gamma [Deltaproteobacteria bacterium]
MRKEIKLAGFGGQGIILMSVMLANAAGYYDDKEIAQTQSYGPEARGGACQAAVVISDKEIDYIKCTNPDVFVAMSQAALDKYLSEVNLKTATILIDDSLVTTVPDNIKTLYKVPATTIAEEECGNKMSANTVMLGAMLKITGLLPMDTLKSTITGHLSKKFHNVNLKALDAADAYCKNKFGL